MRKWKKAKGEWDQFLLSVASAKSDVNCQSRSAWFRGVADESFALLPSLHRNHQSVHTLLVSLAGPSIVKSIKKNPIALKTELSSFVENGGLSVQYARFIADGINLALKSPPHLLAHSIDNLLASFPAERDAYHEFYNRSRATDAKSWEVLASMRHHSVPTRLLDWTESFLVALYFALGRYTQDLISHWRSVKAWKEEFPPFLFPKTAAAPALWVLNPFHLAEASGIVGLIPYPDHPPVPDYYDDLLSKRIWLYTKPIPLHAPKAMARMESQRGHFTVHGLDHAPLERQVKRSSRILLRVSMTPWAAVYGTYFLWQYCNFDAFELFRDLDSLGSVVSSRHFPEETSGGWAYFDDSKENHLGTFAEVQGTDRIRPRPGDRLLVKVPFYARQSPFVGVDVANWRAKPKRAKLESGSVCKVLNVKRVGGILCLQLAKSS